MKNPCKKRFLQKIKDSDVYATVDDVAPTASSKERKKNKMVGNKRKVGAE